MIYFAHFLEKFLLHFAYLILVIFECGIKLRKRVHCLRVQVLFSRVSDLNIESYRDDIKHILLDIVTIPCQHMQQVVLLCQQLMEL